MTRQDEFCALTARHFKTGFRRGLSGVLANTPQRRASEYGFQNQNNQRDFS
jgi:hypothetical protein